MTSRQLKSVIAAILVAFPLLAGAQSNDPPPGQPDSATIRKHKKLFQKRDLVIAGTFAATTMLLFPLDKQFARELQDSSTQANRFFQDASKGVELIASPGAYYIGGALYLVGTVTGKSRIADLGWHGTEAVLLGEGTSMLLKGILGRGRPFVDPNRPRDFEFGRGFGSSRWRSFPSGHTTSAFAAASAVTDETTLWWPKSTWIVGPIMYGGASLVGLSRMYHNRHWASDVAVGALIGTFSGKKVVLASHSSPNNIIDRVMLSGHVQPNEYGQINVGFSKRW